MQLMEGIMVMNWCISVFTNEYKLNYIVHITKLNKVSKSIFHFNSKCFSNYSYEFVLNIKILYYFIIDNKDKC